MLNLPRNLWLAIPVHVVWTLPFSFIVLLAGFPPNLDRNEEAARIMGADNPTVFRKITLPQIAPTVLGAAVFAFTLSYNEATRGLLLTGHDTTMPVEIFTTAVGQRASPDMFALGSITTIFSAILIAIAGGLVIYNR
jgi:putative spermidine/putrescine transport system permease protein